MISIAAATAPKSPTDFISYRLFFNFFSMNSKTNNLRNYKYYRRARRVRYIQDRVDLSIIFIFCFYVFAACIFLFFKL